MNNIPCTPHPDPENAFKCEYHPKWPWSGCLCPAHRNRELDSGRLDKMAEYLSDHTKNISGPFKGDNTWQFGYNGGESYVVDGQGETLREAIDSLTTAN